MVYSEAARHVKGFQKVVSPSVAELVQVSSTQFVNTSKMSQIFENLGTTQIAIACMKILRSD
jgi:hypothetical protein